jgi:CRP-like cAMP-binding protein
MTSILKIFDPPTVSDQIATPLIRRVGAILPLTDEDRRALVELEANPCQMAKGKELIEMGEDGTKPFVLLSGFVIVSRSNSSGERLIIDLMIPGDLGNLRSIVLERADMFFDSVCEVAISRFHPKTYYELLTKRPRLGTALVFANAVDRSLLAERLYSIGRRNGYQRLGHYLLELLMRMRRAGLADGNSFEAPLTLAVLGDLLGMTLEHVSRLMQRLRRDGFVKTERERFAFPDIDGMAAACDFDPFYLHLSDNPEEKQNGWK